MRIFEKIILTAIHDDIDGKTSGKIPVDIVKMPADSCAGFEKTDRIGFNTHEKNAGETQQRQTADGKQNNLTMFQVQPHDKIEKLIEAVTAICWLRSSQFWSGHQHQDSRKCCDQDDKEAEHAKTGKQGKLVYGGDAVDKQGGQADGCG